MGILDDAIREHLELKRRRGADTAEVSRQEREVLGADGTAAAAAPADFAEPVAYDEPDADFADVDPVGEPTGEPFAGAPLLEADPEPVAEAAPEADLRQAVRPVDELFPGTNELLAAGAPAPAEPAPAERTPAPSLGAPAPAGADEETAARSGARRLSDEELAAWRRRLSERADRLAAQRPGGATEPAAGTDPASAAAPAARSTEPAPASADEAPPAYWSGNTAGAPATPAGAAAQPPAAPEPPAGGVPVDFFDAGDAETAFAPEQAPEPEPEADEHDVLDDTPDFLSDTPDHDRMWFEQRPPRDFDFG